MESMELQLMLDLEGLQCEALARVVNERRRQDEKWGKQHRHSSSGWLTILMEELGEAARDVLEGDDAHLLVEVTQVAGVAVAWLEHLLDSRAGREG